MPLTSVGGLHFFFFASIASSALFVITTLRVSHECNFLFPLLLFGQPLFVAYVASQLIQGYSFANLRCHWAVIVGWLQKFSVGWKTDDNEDRFMMSVGIGKM